jgi:chorismate--pyruvate lyase
LNVINKLLAGWQPANKEVEALMPMNLHAWLTEANAITPMLQKQFADWRLLVIGQEWQDLLADEKQAFDLSESKAWVRQIFHVGHEKKQIYAKLSVPKITYEQYQIELESLGNKPIGATLLFNNPDVSRSSFAYRIFKASDPIYHSICHEIGTASELWARRSIFTWRNLPLMLTEIFNPDLAKP